MKGTRKRKSKLAGIVSPPYEKQLQYHANKYDPKKYAPFVKGRIRFNQETGEPIKYGQHKQNIGNLKDKPRLAGVVSPPYSDSNQAEKEGFGHEQPCYCNFCKKNAKNMGRIVATKYSSQKQNIGNLKDKKTEHQESDLSQFHSCDEKLEWHGCYDSDTYWKQFVTPESFAHPAKISFLLAERIFKHLEKLGLLKKNMQVVDFMCGSARINLVANMRGYDSIGVELEKHFCDMAQANIELMKRKAQFCQCKEYGWKIEFFDAMQVNEQEVSRRLNGNL